MSEETTCRTYCPWIQPCTGLTRRVAWTSETVDQRSPRHQVLIEDPYPSSRMSMARLVWVTRAMATPKRGSSLPQRTSRMTSPRKGPGSTSLPRRRQQKFGVTWEPGSATFQYPNTQRPGTVWYHDHTLGMTRLNVYAGPAGFYLIRGGPGDKVVDIRTGTDGLLPGPAPAQGDAPGTKYYEIPLAIQDRSFNKNGSLFYPDSRAFFDGVEGPYIPKTDVSPIWNPEFFGNCMMVNGRTWPFAEVEQRRYRLRLLNGCNSRFLILDFGEIPGVEVWQIGNDGGFLTDPVNLSLRNDNRLLMSPAERADVIVDFTQVQTGRYVLRNVGPDEPFGGGTPGTDFPVADRRTTGRIMQFRVKSAGSEDASTPPKFLRLPSVVHHSGGKVRRLALLEEMSMDFPDAPVEAQLGTVDANPNRGPAGWTMLEWASEVTENPTVGAVEVWEFYNATGDAHPIHIHEVLFQVINRQAVEVEEESASVRVESEKLSSTSAPLGDWIQGHGHLLPRNRHACPHAV